MIQWKGVRSMEQLKNVYHKLDAIENNLYKLCALLGAIAMGIAFC